LLTSFVEDVFTNKWRGREREAVSLYALGYLVPRCGDGRLLRSPTQIGIEVAVPQIPGGKAKAQVCKDLVLWSEPRLTCWDTAWRPTIHPIAIMEWKTNRSSCSPYDIRWLKAYSERVPGFVGYATCLDLTAREFRLACARVESGKVNLEWLRL
jgi:hypothetical protein